MVQVKSSAGGMVQVEILGIGEVMRMIQAKEQQIKAGADFGVVRAGTFIQEEVKESIMGNRAEKKSVRSGNFANSVEFVKTGDAQGVVKPQRKSYPDSTATTVDVAMFMEYGTSKWPHPRRHFGNTKVRNEKNIRDIINNEIQGSGKFGKIQSNIRKSNIRK